MDDFYTALFHGHVKPSGIMNFLQHQYIAERCKPGADVVDVCCGRGLQLPTLYKSAPHIASYTGLDIAPENLREARAMVGRLEEHYQSTFSVDWATTDVSEPWPASVPLADVMINTSAFEHLPRERGVLCLRQMADHLAPGGVLYLSTPESPGPAPRPLQYRVHVYEWNREELEPELDAAGLEIIEALGLLPAGGEVVSAALGERFGAGAAALFARLQDVVPEAFLAPLASAAVPEAASEILYVCRRRA
ncbi:class I SAM-dependent methyltransferase [Streptomyces sp. TRM66268-LWL]|uniref:Class I SAM-dependent methyltransferase n=1 Tax=Streptomyces polyasparticus TaxID=2767826 RepID=A0ABR7SUG1_9ACTN|nr:class I SAM-dependent methyltransferase [Streptomyces polyasparticus]MBC9718434.1 class I SAM-dependent methyltransferase [Streptomyces polyasparticus]